MVYAGDLWIQLPVKDLYDTLMMAMAINAARDMYNRGEKKLDDFYEKYNDFISPILKDMDSYNTIIGGVKDTINNIYARGGDPLRNAQDRAEMMAAIRNVPVGDINKLRQSAETAKEYVKNAGKLAAAGLLNDDAEKNYFGRDLSTWDTLNGNGVWRTSSPVENKTIDEIIEPIIKNLDYTYDEARTKEANDGNDYYTVTEDRIRKTIADSMPDLMVDKTMGGYYYDKALKASGNDAEKAKQLYTDWLVNRSKDHLKEKFEPNKYKLEEFKHQLDLQLEGVKHANRMRESQTIADSLYQQDYDFESDVYDKMLNNIVGNPGGYQYEDANGNPISAMRRFDGQGDLILAQRDFGTAIATSNVDRNKAYRQKYTHTTNLSGQLFANFLDRDLYEGKTNNNIDWKGRGVVRLDEKDLGRITSVRSMITNTAGYPGKYSDGSEKDVNLISKINNEPEKYLIGGNNIDMYGAARKYGRFQNDFIVNVYEAKSGKKVGEVAYNSGINSTKTKGGFYQRNKSVKSNTARDLRNRQSTVAGSTAVNKKQYSTTRKQEMPNVIPYVYLTN